MLSTTRVTLSGQLTLKLIQTSLTAGATFVFIVATWEFSRPLLNSFVDQRGDLAHTNHIA